MQTENENATLREERRSMPARHDSVVADHRTCSGECYLCKLERRLVDLSEELDRMRRIEGWLRHIQHSAAGSRWQTAGDLYRGKLVFLPQDLINAVDAALE
jgi:hypothetical protein